MSPPLPTLPMFATAELTFSDEPRLPIPGPATDDLVFSDDVPVKVVKKERPKVPAAPPKKRRATQKAKAAAAAARQKDPHYHPLKFRKDFKLIVEPEVAAMQLKNAAGQQPKSSSSSGRHGQVSSVEDDSNGRSTPMVSDDESYAPSRTGNRRKKSAHKGVRSRKLPSVEDSVSSGFGSDDQTEPKLGLLPSTFMSSHGPFTPKLAAERPLPPRRRREPSMYTPLKEFLYNGQDAASKRKGHVCEEERIEHEKMKISSLRSKLASRIHALETYMATASLAAGMGQSIQTYDTISVDIKEDVPEKTDVDIAPVVKKRKRRRRGFR